MAEETTKKENSQTGRSSSKKLFFWLWRGLAVLLVIFGAVASLSFWSKATLTVTLGKEPQSLENKIEVNLSADTVDFEQKILPGKLFDSAEKEKWQVFQTTGLSNQSTKAKGTITVYNKQDPPKAVSLIVNTRFLSAKEGKIFRTVKKIVIPAAQKQGGQLAPGSIQVEVIADEPGDSYNIEPSQFSVPGLTGSSLYYVIWAESKTAISGGSQSDVKEVSQEDIDLAQDDLRYQLIDLAIQSLTVSSTDGYLFNKEAVFDETIESSCFQKPGDQVAEFNCQAKGKFTFLAPKENDLKSLALALLKEQMPPQKTLLEDTLEIAWQPKTVLVDKNSMLLDATITGQSYQDLQQDVFLSQIVGQTADQIQKLIFESYPQIKKIDFKFWPFWMKKTPKDSQKIELDLQFE